MSVNIDKELPSQISACHILFDLHLNIVGVNQGCKDFLQLISVPVSVNELDISIKRLSSGEVLSIDALAGCSDELETVPVMVVSSQGVNEGHVERLDSPQGSVLSLSFDIAKHSDSYLERSEVFKFRTILEGSQAGTWEWNVQTGELRLNEHWAQIIGYRLDEIRPISIETWLEYVHPDDLQLSNQALDAHFSGEHPFYHCEARMRHKAGHWVWVRDYGRVITRVENGSPEWITGTHIDISADKAIQAKLTKVQTRLDAIIKSCPAVIYTATMFDSYDISYFSHDVALLLGFKAEEAVGKKSWWFRRVHPEDVRIATSQLNNWLAKGAPGILQRRYRFRHKRGHFVWLADEVRQFDYQDQAKSNYIGTLSDISHNVALTDRLASLANISPGVIYQYELRPDDTHRFSYVSKRMTEMAGLSPEELQEDAKPFFDLVCEDDLDHMSRCISESARNLTDWACEFRITKDSQKKWLFGHSVPEKQQDDSILWSGVFIDITDKKQLELELANNREKLQAAQAIGRLGYWEMDLDSDVLYWSDMIYDICGFSKNEAPPSVDLFRSLVFQEDLEFSKFTELAAKSSGVTDTEYRMRHADGHTIWVHAHATKTLGENVIKGTILDISKRKELEFKLRTESITDPLTGVVNRRHYVDVLSTELERYKREGHEFSIVMIDFDDFKEVNDKFGHGMGDAVLIDTVELINKRVRSYDIFARLGGDEFALLLPETNLQEAKILVDSLQQAISRNKIQLDGMETTITVSMGIAVADQGYANIETIMKVADGALYHGKSQRP